MSKAPTQQEIFDRALALVRLAYADSSRPPSEEDAIKAADKICGVILETYRRSYSKAPVAGMQRERAASLPTEHDAKNALE